MIFIELTWSGPACPGPDTLCVLAQVQQYKIFPLICIQFKLLHLHFKEEKVREILKQEPPTGGGMERSLPWTEMRDTNKTEISLAAMALVITGRVSVHNLGVYMFWSFTWWTVLLVAGFSTYCCHCYSSAPRSQYCTVHYAVHYTVHTGVLVLNCEEST